VVAIVADRITKPDARNGFILDGFPRTVPQAEALARMLHEKDLDLDAVIELKVDEGILLDRVRRRVNETLARGEPVRADDNPDSLKKRLDAYRVQTAPLVHHYAAKGSLKTIDGMAEIADVTSTIGRILAENMFRAAPAKAKATPPAGKAPAPKQDPAKAALEPKKPGGKPPAKAKSPAKMATKSTAKGKPAGKPAAKSMAKNGGAKKATRPAKSTVKPAAKRAGKSVKPAKKTASKKGRKTRK
jgi:adenylate kinase